jgi:hypothetical protein
MRSPAQQASTHQRQQRQEQCKNHKSQEIAFHFILLYASKVAPYSGQQKH